MQSASFTLSSASPSLFLTKPRRPLSFNPRFDSIRASSASRPNDLSNVNLSARRSWSLSSSSSSFKLRPWTNSLLPSHSDAKMNRLEVRATAVPESAGEKPESSSLFKTLELGSLFGLWYLFNIYFNIYNKQVRFFFYFFFWNFRLRICECVAILIRFWEKWLVIITPLALNVEICGKKKCNFSFFIAVFMVDVDQ